jgi:hypothetical protein
MLKRVGLVVAMTAVSLMVLVGSALAQTPDADVVDAITEATANVKVTLLALIGIGLAIGVVLYLMRKGWRTFKGFAK